MTESDHRNNIAIDEQNGKGHSPILPDIIIRREGNSKPPVPKGIMVVNSTTGEVARLQVGEWI